MVSGEAGAVALVASFCQFCLRHVLRGWRQRDDSARLAMVLRNAVRGGWWEGWGCCAPVVARERPSCCRPFPVPNRTGAVRKRSLGVRDTSGSRPVCAERRGQGGGG